MSIVPNLSVDITDPLKKLYNSTRDQIEVAQIENVDASHGTSLVDGYGKISVIQAVVENTSGESIEDAGARLVLHGENTDTVDDDNTDFLMKEIHQRLPFGENLDSYSVTIPPYKQRRVNILAVDHAACARQNEPVDTARVYLPRKGELLGYGFDEHWMRRESIDPGSVSYRLNEPTEDTTLGGSLPFYPPRIKSFQGTDWEDCHLVMSGSRSTKQKTKIPFDNIFPDSWR